MDFGQNTPLVYAQSLGLWIELRGYFHSQVCKSTVYICWGIRIILNNFASRS